MTRSPETRTKEIELFEYPQSGKEGRNCWEGLPEAGCLAEASPQPTSLAGAGCSESKSDFDTATVRDLEKSFQTGREQGIREGREEAQAAQKLRLQEIETRRMAQAAELVNRFAQERDHLLAAVEQEVVRLTLAIAERVLRREAEIDPLFLVGAVRIALGQLLQSTHVRLRIPSSEAELWTETIAHIPNLRVKPEIVPDAALRLGDCVIESEMGSADLGLAAQLDTIRQALLDEPQRGEICSEQTPPSRNGETGS